MLKIATGPKFRRCIAINETELKVKGEIVYVWAAVDVETKELLAMDASY